MKVSSPRARSATIAMIDLAKRQGDDEDNWVGISDLATLQHKSRSYMETTFKMLKAAGLVDSKKGPNGGYRIEDPRLVTVADINIAITGDNPDDDARWEAIKGNVKNAMIDMTVFDHATC